MIYYVKHPLHALREIGHLRFAAKSMMDALRVRLCPPAESETQLRLE